MDVALIIKRRLDELSLEQRELAAAAAVTESYVSQILNRKKSPPAPGRTDIYARMEKFLQLPKGELSKLADLQRKEDLKRSLSVPAAPLLGDLRELVLRKCPPGQADRIRAIFEKQPIGELERLITQKLLDVVKAVAKEELENENWLRLVARLGGRSYEEMRVAILEFLDTDVFHISPENCVSFLDPLIESWDIDLSSFAIQIVLAPRLAPGCAKRFEFIETGTAQEAEEAGLREFLRDKSLSGTATEEEIRFLRRLRFKGRQPTALYYYREWQNLRDPLHFTDGPESAVPEPPAAGRGRDAGKRRNPRNRSELAVAPMQKRREADGIEQQMKAETRQAALRRWTLNKTKPARAK
jgi:transcriptional regulator with XRE-family HTH domain